MSAPFNNDQKSNINNMKRNLRLELNQDKKITNAPVLSSPDFNMLNVDTPELEKMILQNGNIVNTPTPSGLIFPKIVTEEQESFSAGFVNALNNLHNSNSNMSNSQSIDGNSKVYADLEQQNNLSFLPIVKEEPQTVPNISSSPPVSPVDMEYQERMKLERKRQRNRLAASKCRSRKLERISKLEEKVKLLKSENVELGSMVNQLKEHVGLLKVEVMSHYKAGCALRLVPNSSQYYDP